MKTQCILRQGELYAPRYNTGFGDIELDTSRYPYKGVPPPDIAPCPINLITYIDTNTKSVYSFILYDERVGKEIKEVISNPQAFLQEYADPDILKENFKYYFKAYQTELELITDFFHTLHVLKPDFVGWWNMAFDIPTIINRLKNEYKLSRQQIGNIMCHPDIPPQYRIVQYIPDPKRSAFDVKEDDDDDEDEEEKEHKSKNSQNRPHPSRLWDYAKIPGYTQHFDQMTNFSNLRKRWLLKSYKLKEIGKSHGGVNKMDLEDLGYDIKTVFIENFKLGLAYNIQDSYVQYKIDQNQHDINNLVLFSGNSRVMKSHSASITIKNEIYINLFKENQIMGSEVYYDIFEKLDGAIVGRPELIEQLGILVQGTPSYIFDDVIDLDATSLYPSLMIINNLFKSAIYGRVTDVYVNNMKYSSGIGLFEAIQTIDQSILDIGQQYFKLPSVSDICALIEQNATFRYNEKRA